MTGRMESVENLGEQRRGFASQRPVSHPSHRPLEIAKAIPTFPQPRRRRFSLTNLQTTNPRGHFYCATEGDISIVLQHDSKIILQCKGLWCKLRVYHSEEVCRLPFVSRRAQLRLGSSEIKMLTTLSQSRSEPAGRVQRASILLRYHAGDTVSEIAGPWAQTGHGSSAA